MSRGLTLVECLAALRIAAVLLAAVTALLLVGWRSARAQSTAITSRQSVRAAADVLRAELLGVSASAGDLLAISDSAVALRASRALGFVCRPPSGTSIALSDSLLGSTRTIDPSRDSALVFREGDSLTSDDDRWLRAGIASATGGTCSDGSSATALSLTGASPADLSGLAIGAPVRTFEVLEYRRYRDGSHQWMLGVRGPAAGGGWASSSPIAGPLRAADGLVFRYFSADGNASSIPAQVALVEATIRSPADSMVIRVWVGGP